MSTERKPADKQKEELKNLDRKELPETETEQVKGGIPPGPPNRKIPAGPPI